MNAEELEIARRLVACKGWTWLPGMVALRLDDDDVIIRIRIEIIDERCAVVRGERYALRGMVPDLSDDLTRLGVLAVVRRALGSADVWVAPKLSPDPRERGWLVFGVAIVVGEGPTEEAALLSTLEATA